MQTCKQFQQPNGGSRGDWRRSHDQKTIYNIIGWIELGSNVDSTSTSENLPKLGHSTFRGMMQ